MMTLAELAIEEERLMAHVGSLIGLMEEKQAQLAQDGTFDAYAQNVRTLPFTPNGVIIRSFFNRGGWHTRAQPGHISVQLVQPAAEFMSRVDTGGYGSYFELVN